MPKIYLTDDVVLGAVCPPQKSQEFYWDYAVSANGHIRNGSISGLGLRVTGIGHKAFVHAYQFNGRRYRKVLGSTTTYSVASARLAIIEREKQLAAGCDPEEGRVNTRRKHFMTVREAIDQYWESHVSGLSSGYRDNFAIFVAVWRKRVPEYATRRGFNSKRRYRDFGTLFGDRAFQSIKPLDIEQFQKQFTSAYVFNSALRHVLALYNWAIRMQLVDMRNPCSPIRARKQTRRRRDYTTEQIKKIATHVFYPVMEIPPEVEHLEGFEKRDMALVRGRVLYANEQMRELCNYMGILFLTMARPSDLTKAEFDHFDLDKLIWHKLELPLKNRTGSGFGLAV